MNKRQIRRNKIRDFFSQPANIILVVLLILLAVTTIYPIITMILKSFTLSTQEMLMFPDYNMGDLFVDGWKKLLGGSDWSVARFYTPFVHSLTLSVIASFFAVLIGGVFAFFVCRTNVKWKGITSTLFIFPYIMPSWTIALFWRDFFINDSFAAYNGLFTSLCGLRVPQWFVYGGFPIGLTLGIHYAPFAYILIGGILKNMDANLEEAATILKTPRSRIITRITLPIVLPALLNTVLLVFASSISAYSVPVFLGSPANYSTLTTSISFFKTSYPSLQYAVGLILIVLGLTVLGINNLLTGRRKSYTTVTGKSSQVSYIDLKGGKYPVAVVGMLIVVFISLFPLVVFFLESILIDHKSYAPSNWTSLYWLGDPNNRELLNSIYMYEGGILRMPSIWNALKNSLILSVLCSIFAGTAGLLTGYAVVRKKGTKLASVVSTLAFLPYLIPSLAFGLAYLAFAARVPVLMNSLALLVLLGSIKYMPFATRSATGAMMQLSAEIEEAAILTGTPWWKRMVRIIFPIQKSSFLSGYLLPFISCMRELSLFVFVVANNRMIVTTFMMYFDEKGLPQYGNAINMLIVIVVLLINMTINKLTGASIDKGVGGN